MYILQDVSQLAFSAYTLYLCIEIRMLHKSKCRVYFIAGNTNDCRTVISLFKINCSCYVHEINTARLDLVKVLKYIITIHFSDYLA